MRIQHTIYAVNRILYSIFVARRKARLGVPGRAPEKSLGRRGRSFLTLRVGNSTIRAVSNPKFSKHHENSDASTICGPARDESAARASANDEAVAGESMADRSTERRMSRRQFGRRAAAAIAAAATVSAPGLLAANVADAQTRTQKRATSPPLQQEKPEPLEGLTPEQAAEVEARLANILRKYGSRFTEDQKTHLRGILAQNERMMAPVRAFALQNGDPPASVLRISFDERGGNRQEQEKDGR